MNDVVSLLKHSDNFLILCHKNPDGDAVGSSMALYCALKKLNKKVDVLIEDVPKKFSFLIGYNEIISTSDKRYEVGIVVDTAEEKLICKSEMLDSVDKLIVIDHHISNSNYGDINYVNVTSACALNVYDVIKKLNVVIDRSIAEPIYLGILTDSNGLSNSDVNKNVFLAVSELSDIIDTSKVYKKVLGTITKSEFNLRKIAIDNLEFYSNDRISLITISEDDINKCKSTKDECSGLVNIGREIEGVIVSILIRRFNDEIRVSLRSNDKNISVNDIAQVYGGGGHVCAAGIILSTDIDYVSFKEELIERIETKINEWDNSSK